MPRTRPPYPPAFRAEAVALLRTSAKTVPGVARDLGINGQTLRNWLHQADVDAGRGGPSELTTTEREELRQLRREVRTLQQEREILKKPAWRCVAPPRGMKMVARRSAANLVASWCQEPDEKTEAVAGRHHTLLPRYGGSTRGKVLTIAATR